MARKRKAEEEHIPTCNDTTCTGCGSGEIEIVFTDSSSSTSAAEETPKPSELYRLAMQEKDAAGSQNTQVVIKLFEMALEGFEKEVELTSSGHLLFAQCLREFGVYMRLLEMLERSESELKKIVADGDKESRSTAYMHLGALNLDKLLAKHNLLGISVSSEVDEDDDDEDDEEECNIHANTEEASRTPLLDRADDLLVSKAVELISKGISESTAKLPNILHSGRTLLDCALMGYVLRRRSNSSKIVGIGLTLSLAGAAIEVVSCDDSAYLNCDTSVSLIAASCRYHSARCYSKLGNIPSAENELTKAIRLLSGSPHKELLGQCYILMSSVANDDDLALSAFSGGVGHLRDALAEDPTNFKLKAQVDAFGTLSEFDDDEREEDCGDEEDEEL